MYTEFTENPQVIQASFNLSDEAFNELSAAIDANIDDIELQRPSSASSGWSPFSMDKTDASTSDPTSPIFLDFDA